MFLVPGGVVGICWCVSLFISQQYFLLVQPTLTNGTHGGMVLEEQVSSGSLLMENAWFVPNQVGRHQNMAAGEKRMFVVKLVTKVQ